MMDKKQQHILAKMGGSIPAHLQRALIKTEIETDQEGIARDIIKNKATSASAKKRLQAALDAGAFGKSRKVVDPRVEKEIDNFIGNRVRNDMRSGRLKPPVRDKFTQMVRRNMTRKV